MNRKQQIADNIAKSFVSGWEDNFEKAEGDRGGQVIGHTKSGKPIYKDGSNADKYTAQDHHEAFEHHAAITDDWRTREKHYGKQEKKDKMSTREKHLELSRVHSVESWKDIKEGETGEFDNTDGTKMYVTRKDKIIHTSNKKPE